MPEERIPNSLLHWIPKHGKKCLSRVLEDTALFIGVDNITMEAAEQQATDRAQWRSLIRRYKELHN